MPKSDKRTPNEAPASTPSERAQVRRQPGRARYDRETIDAILDAALVCHVGISRDDGPYVFPTLHARTGDRVYFHGSAGSRALRALAAGTPLCLTATLIDGLVLARSALHHSVNYRSVVLYGTATAIAGEAEKRAALEAFTEHLIPGRWRDVRPPTGPELKATTVLWMGIDEASAKVRQEPPRDDEADYALDAWAGILPLRLAAGPPEPDPLLRPGIPPPPYLTGYATLTGR